MPGRKQTFTLVCPHEGEEGDICRAPFEVQGAYWRGTPATREYPGDPAELDISWPDECPRGHAITDEIQDRLLDKCWDQLRFEREEAY